MLISATQILPRTSAVYAAFRLACLDTRERLELAHQLDLNPERTFGFLIEVPFLRNVPAHVQLDLLFDTWVRQIDPSTRPATLLDEAVVYAACETAARMIRTEPETVRRFLARGPIPFDERISLELADLMQQLHLKFSHAGLFLVLSQFHDIPPRDAEQLKLNCGLSDEMCECLFDVLGRWYVSRSMLAKTSGLLTRVETEQLGLLLEAARCCGSAG